MCGSIAAPSAARHRLSAVLSTGTLPPATVSAGDGFTNIIVTLAASVHTRLDMMINGGTAAAIKVQHFESLGARSSSAPLRAALMAHTTIGVTGDSVTPLPCTLRARC